MGRNLGWIISAFLSFLTNKLVINGEPGWVARQVWRVGGVDSARSKDSLGALKSRAAATDKIL